MSAAVSQTTISSAVTALLKHKTSSASAEKLQLLPQDDYLYLNITLKTIPTETRTSPFLIPLPHPITDSTSELCLIIDDRPSTKTPPSDQIKKLIKSQNIQISKVIKLSKLKANYKAFEAKRKLCDSYDVFLVDKAVVHLLPKLIGKKFFKKKKLPLGVDLRKKNLKGQVERVLGSGLLYLRSGTCCVMKVGRVGMEMDEIVENVNQAIESAVGLVERELEGVRSLFLKFSGSVALPVYQAMPDVKLKSEETEDGEDKKAVKGKVSDSEGKDMSAKKIGKKKNKGRIHEVKYMDVDDDDVVDVALNGIEEVLGDVGIDGSDEDLKVEKTVGKKRKVSEEKKVKKKKAKVDKSEDENPKGNDGIESVEKKRKKKSDVGVAMKSKKTDGVESEEVKPAIMSKEGVSKKSDKVDGVDAGEIKPRKQGKEGVVKKSKKAAGVEAEETKPKKKSEEGMVKKSKKTDELASGDINPKKKGEKGAAEETDAIESGEKKVKKKGETEKKLKGVARVKDGKQKKRVSFE